jgi:flagellar basal-body rod protein FlgB
MILGPDKMGAWLERALDLSSQRASVLRSNLANVDTPGYVAKDVDFTGALADALERRSPDGTVQVRSEVVERSEVEPGLDANRVDLDQEMVRMAANKAFNQVATEGVTRRMALLRYAIDEGGR